MLRVFDETIEIAISKSLACKCVANFRELCSSVKHAFEIVLRVVPISGCYVLPLLSSIFCLLFLLCAGASLFSLCCGECEREKEEERKEREQWRWARTNSLLHGPSL